MFDLIPFRRGGNDIYSFFDEMDKNFRKNYGEHLPAFKTDIMDKGKKFVLEAEMPGFDKEDIDIHVEHNKLTIKAAHDTKKENNKENYIHRERKYGSFTRSFDISDINTEEIKADYKNGVLILDLPKKSNKSCSKRIDIQ